MEDFTNLDDYSNGFLGGEQAGTAELLKAMQAGRITGRDTANQALTMEPLKVESLEKTLKHLEFKAQEIKLLNAIPKMTAFNTVEEFLQLKSYGEDRGGFYDEGELSDVEDSQYVRRSELIKYIQVTGEVTVQAQMVRSYVDAMRKEVENKTLWIMRRANKALTFGDSDIIDQEFNSLYKQHQNIGTSGDYLYASLLEYYASDVVVDLRGKSLTQVDIEKAAVIVDDNHGYVTDIYGPNNVISALMQDYFGDQRIVMPATGFNGTIGTVPTSIGTSINPKVKLNSDKFMKRFPKRKLVDNATSPKAPTAPTAVSLAVAVDSNSSFVTGDAGNAYYAVAAINRYGESALTSLSSSPVAIVAGSSIDCTFTAAASQIPAVGFVIYRTKVGAAGTTDFYYPIFKVSVAQLASGYDGGAAGKVRDRGHILPACEDAFLTEMSDDVLSFKQLAPISKLDLAVVSMARRFIAFNFCCPNLYAPKKMVKFINVLPTLNS